MQFSLGRVGVCILCGAWVRVGQIGIYANTYNSLPCIPVKPLLPFSFFE